MSTPPLSPRHVTPFAIALVLLAAVVRLVALRGEGLWLDEARSLHLALQPAGQIVAATADDIHPPLYPLLLHVWLSLTGPSVLAARLLSVILSLPTVVIAMRMAGSASGRRGALIAGLVFAIAPYWVYYSTEIRPYALLGLLAMLATSGLWRLCTLQEHPAPEAEAPAPAALAPELSHLAVTPALPETPPRCPGSGFCTATFVLASLAGLYTMYVAGLVLAAHAAAGLWLCRLRRPLFGLSLLVIAAGFLPWLPRALPQVTRLPEVFVPESSLGRLLATPVVWLGGYAQMRRPTLFPSSEGSGLVVATTLALIAAAIMIICSLSGECFGPARRQVLPRLLLLTAIAPPILLWLVSLARPMYATYALLPSGLAMLLLIGISMAQLPPKRSVFATVICCALFVASLALYLATPNYGRGRTMEQLADHLRQTVQPGDLVVFQDEALFLPVRVYGELQGDPPGFQAVMGVPPTLQRDAALWPPVVSRPELARLAGAARRIVLVAREGESSPGPARALPPLARHTVAGSTQNPTVEVITYPPQAYTSEG